MRWRWNHRGLSNAIAFSKRTAHTDGVRADSHQVSYAFGGSQSNSDKTKSGTLIKPADGGTDADSGTDRDAIGDGGSLAVTDPAGDHYDPDRHRSPGDSDSDCSPESVDGHPVRGCQPIAECEPVAVPIHG